MNNGLSRDPLFVALTRPQMFAGVTYTVFVVNGIVSTEFFLIFKSAWVLLFAVLVHIAGVVASVREPRVFDLWLLRLTRVPRVRNFRFWQCNSYRA